MRKFNVLATSIILALGSQVVVAADYLLDASTMSVGSTAGENLVVKEGCLDPTKTSCTEKFKWLTATSAIKIGNLQVTGELKGDFEVVITLDAGSDPKSIKLLTADNKGIQLSFNGDSPAKSFGSNGVGEGGGRDCCYSALPGWNSGYAFNEVKLTVQQGVAKIYTNGTNLFDPVTFDAGQTFNRVSFEGFTVNDRISDVKIRGISNVASCSGSSTTTTPVSGTTNTGDLPQISSNLDIKIPRGLYAQSGGLFTPAGSIPVWADLKYNAGGNYWTLSGAGVLPK